MLPKSQFVLLSFAGFITQQTMTLRVIFVMLLGSLLASCALNEPPRDINTPYTFPNRGGTDPNVPSVPRTPPTSRVFISNKYIKLGIDPNLGGSITYLSEQGQPNLVNNYDNGRQIQNSIYSGPVPYGPNGQQPHPIWINNGWNPVQSGDYGGTAVMASEWRKIDSTHLYVRSNGIQWPLINVPGECVMENWIELRDNTVWGRSRITIQRKDTTFYNPMYQETPAVCLNGPWHRFVYYGGSRPFTNDAVSVHPDNVDKPTFYIVPECWGAMLDKSDHGIGLYRPNMFQFATSFSGQRGTGGEFDFTSGYMTGLPVEQIDHNGVFEFEYVLILGSLNDIRQFVYSQPKPRSVPDFVFDNGRKGWSYFNTRDQGWPIRSALNVHWEPVKPNLLFRIASPFMFFAGSSAPRLYVQAAFTTNAKTAHFVWTKQGDNDFHHRSNQEIDFPIIGDGQMRIYEVDLSRVASWQGFVTRIGIEPTTFEGLEKGGMVRIKSITTTRP